MSPPLRLSLAEWSLHREILDWQPRHLEFPRVAKEVFGLDAIEYRSTFFAGKATDFAYLAEMRKRADDAGVKPILIEVDDAGPLGAAEFEDRYAATGAHFQWLAAAAFLGCESVSVAAEGLGRGAPYLEWTADSLQRLGSIAHGYGISVLVGNRKGLACDGSWMATLMQVTAHPMVGTHPHADNFELGGGRVYPRCQGVEEMMPWARALSVRAGAADPDLERIARIAASASYAGVVCVEYDGPGKDERAGTKRAIELVRAAWEKV
jgi:L-ribulose-5-phosphate 3-epimerase